MIVLRKGLSLKKLNDWKKSKGDRGLNEVAFDLIQRKIKSILLRANRLLLKDNNLKVNRVHKRAGNFYIYGQKEIIEVIEGKNGLINVLIHRNKVRSEDIKHLDPKMFLFAKKENPSTYDHKDWDIDKTVFAENLINLLN